MGEVSENAQGMLLYKWGSMSQAPKRGSSLVQVTGDSLTLVSKIESIEEHQALEKDHLDVVNKQWAAKLEAIEGLIKTLLSQAQEKLLLAFVQNLGMGYRSGNNSEPLGRPLKTFHLVQSSFVLGVERVAIFKIIVNESRLYLQRGLLYKTRREEYVYQTVCGYQIYLQEQV